MAILKCKMCGGNLEIQEGVTVCECEYCGSKQTVPKFEDDKRIKLYERANRLRMACEFDKAASVYESIVEESDTEAEAYWGILLCKYGIEYVDDPTSGDKIPTCHRSSFDSILDDPDFDMVMENADTLSKSVYREQAKQIEEIRKGILEVSGKEAPYDIFICYKETDANGDRTIDSVIAQDVYDVLSDKGYKVFFSRISLEDKLGTEYEPYIFAALNSAKIMLAFGTDYDYYNAVWVKNEWSRFLKIMTSNKEKYLIPCYKGIDAYDMPKEFSKLQAQDMGKVGATQDLVRGIEKLIGKAKNDKQDNSQTVVQQVVQNVGGTNVDALIQRGFMALEDGEWSDAKVFFDDVLNQDAQNGQAYLGKLLAECKKKRIEDLSKCKTPFGTNKHYEKVVRFGDDELVEELKKYNEIIIQRNELKEKENVYSDAMSKKRSGEYESAIILLNRIVGFKDVEKQISECKKAQEEEVEQIDGFIKSLDTIARVLMDETIRKRQTEINQIDEQITYLDDEFSTLGIFAGKRKKEIPVKKYELEAKKRRFEWDIKEDAKTMQKCLLNDDDEKIKACISNSVDIKVIIKDLYVKNSELFSNQNGQMNYAEAEKLLKNQTIKKLFLIKYKVIYYLRRGVRIEGNNLIFGYYNGEGIKWRILEEKEDKLLLLSEYAICGQPYLKISFDSTPPTWEICFLRRWLNNVFIYQAFRDSEQEYISRHITNDKVFCLNKEELKRYIPSTKNRICVAPVQNDIVNVNKDNICCWWLRQDKAPDGKKIRYDYVDFRGDIESRYVEYEKIGVRPAIWLNLE